MKKRIPIAVLSASLAVMMLNGCGQGSGKVTTQTETTEKVITETGSGESETAAVEQKSPDVTDPVKLTFVFADGDEGAKASINQLVNHFNAAHSDIIVTIEPGTGGAYNEFLKTKDSVGEFPDVMEMRDTAVYVRAGKLEPLSQNLIDLFRTTLEFEGAVYTAPMSAENTQGIIYNKTYFDENDLIEPATYDEFLQLCQVIKENGDMAPLVVGGQDIWHMGFLFHKVYNDQVLSQDPDFIKHCYEGTKDFTDPTMKATFRELQNLMQYAQEGWVSTPDAQITTFLVNDMAAMMYSGTHMFSQIASADPDFQVGWFPIPSPDGKLRLVGGGGISGLAISAESAQDPSKKAAAEEFIRFFFQPENYKNYCETLSFIPTTVNQPDLDVTPEFQAAAHYRRLCHST